MNIKNKIYTYLMLFLSRKHSQSSEKDRKRDIGNLNITKIKLMLKWAAQKMKKITIWKKIKKKNRQIKKIRRNKVKRPNENKPDRRKETLKQEKIMNYF